MAMREDTNHQQVLAGWWYKRIPIIDVFQMVVRDLPFYRHVHVRWRGKTAGSCTGCNRLPEPREYTIDGSRMVAGEIADHRHLLV